MRPGHRFTIAVEGDYVSNRIEATSTPATVFGGAAYARYQFNPRCTLAARAEYLADPNGLFSGVSQTLKETTITADFPVTDGFLIRTEWRRDFSNQPFFLASDPTLRKKEQNTATVGLLWWFGGKDGA